MSDDSNRYPEDITGSAGPSPTDEEVDEFLMECEGMTKAQWEGYKKWCDGKGPKEFKIIDEDGRQIIYR